MSSNQSSKPWNNQYPYEVDYNDHFETPLRAYQDILFLLDFVAPKTNKKNQPQTLYDPYYCNGKTIQQLETLGYHHHQSSNTNLTSTIIHEKRDFYKDIQNNSIPKYDTLITNPPYSSNHKQLCLNFCIQQIQNHQKFFFILMPNYVANKDYYRKILHDLSSDFTIVYFLPNIPYEYEHPEGTGKTIPPFASIWFIGITKIKMQLLKQKTDSDILYTNNGKLIFDIQQLQTLGAVPTIKRLNPKQRKKRKQSNTNSNTNSSTFVVSNSIHSQPKRKIDDSNHTHTKKKKKSIYRDTKTGIRTKKRF